MTKDELYTTPQEKKELLLKALEANGLWEYKQGHYIRCNPCFDGEIYKGYYDYITIYEDYIGYMISGYADNKGCATIQGKCHFDYLKIENNRLKMHMPLIDLEILL